MGEFILKTDIKVEEGKIYYCKSENGYITVCKATRGRKRKEENTD